MEKAEKAYTVNQLAELWQVSAATIYEMVNSGEMPHFKIGKLVRFTDNHLAAFTKNVKDGFTLASDKSVNPNPDLVTK